MASSSEEFLKQDKLLATFFDAVKKCQIRFGGKTELATEGDSCVVILCQSLEDILTHGLRLEGQNKGIKAIRHVKDFVSSGLSLHLSNPATDKPVLWWFVRELLTKHEYQRFMLLRNLTTDQGRGKAWLRSLLNEHSLERYIQIILSEKELLESWFEPYAVLRDIEKTAILPNLVAGLDSILFAINIDNEALDGLPKPKNKSANPIASEENPAIIAKESPSISKKNVYKKKKRKVPSQLVSFDEEDLKQSSCPPHIGYHSAPTTCVNSPAAFTAKLSPYEDSLNEAIQGTTKSSRNQEELCTKVSEQESKSYQSATSHSSSDSSSVDQTRSSNAGLTTMSGTHLDLIPLSPDGDMIFDFNSGECGSIPSSHGSIDISQDIDHKHLPNSVSELSISSETSGRSTVTASSFSSLTIEELRCAVLEISKARDTIEEKRAELTSALSQEMEVSSTLRAQLSHEATSHSEALGKLTQKVNSLTRENELLRHQLKKYVGAVQMLKREGAEGAANLDAGMNTIKKPPDLRDYHDEALAYENKLIQVAEMHGELIEFNERLQKLLRHRELQVTNLKEELVELRGPLPEDQHDVELEDAISITSDMDVTNSPRTLINVWIPTAFLSGSSSDAHHVYQIYVRIRDDEWNVYRRFAQFYELHRKFKKRFPVARTFIFPQKKTFGNKDMNVVEERRVRLQQYLRQVVNVLISTNPHLATDPDKPSLMEALPFLSDSSPQRAQAPPRQSTSRNLFSRLSSRQETQPRPAPLYNGL